jgi:tRNA (guanine-N7-)-methyltransferase
MPPLSLACNRFAISIALFGTWPTPSLKLIANAMDETGTPKSRPPLRSFGRRKARKLSPRQEKLVETLLPALSLDLSEPPPAAGLPSLFGTPVSEIWLEIGFGGGEHLLWQATHHPQIGVIGAEPFLNGVVAAISAAAETSLLDRVRIHMDDVRPLLDWLPAASLSKVFILFPDPWPKKRHRERRLFSRDLLNSLARVLKPGAELRFASDVADYAEDALNLLQAHEAFCDVRFFSSNQRETVHDWPQTRYERKAGTKSIFIYCYRCDLIHPMDEEKGAAN